MKLLLHILGLVSLLISGAGKYSVDAWLSSKKKA